MSGRFVRASKYRHVFGKSTRKDFCYDNLHISHNAWDTNLVKVNPQYLSVNWDAGGGGAFAVVPLNETGKLPEIIPLFRGHTSAVLDTDWNPFNDRIVASASDDGKVMIWQVPDGFTLFTDAEEPADVAPISRLGGHTRKVGQVVFNPAAENILASASGDLTVKIWDVGTGSAPLSLKHTDVIQSLSWNASGSMLVTTSRDKKLRVWDVRQERPAHESAGHAGAKNSRAVWMGDKMRFATAGSSRMSDRQLALWEPGNPKPIGGFMQLDSMSGVNMPFWDDSCNCLYLAGKGDGNIRYYEYENDTFQFLSEYKSLEPQRGMAFMPKRGVNVHENEVMRAFKTVNDAYIEPISFVVPRRAETFQSDIFPPAVGSTPGLSAEEWLSGKTALPPNIDFESIYEGNAPVEVPADAKPATTAPVAKPTPKKEPEPAPASAPVVAKAPATMKDQKNSMEAMASKFNDEEEDEEDDDDFEEVTKRTQRTAPKPIQGETKQPPSKTSTAPAPKEQSPIKSPPARQTPVPNATASSTPAPSTTVSSGVEGTLDQIKQLLEAQTKMISTHGQQINHLTGEVESLKKRVGSGSQDQSERIRQLELELESLR